MTQQHLPARNGWLMPTQNVLGQNTRTSRIDKYHCPLNQWRDILKHSCCYLPNCNRNKQHIHTCTYYNPNLYN